MNLRGVVQVRKSLKNGKWYVSFPTGFGRDLYYYPSHKACLDYLRGLGW